MTTVANPIYDVVFKYLLSDNKIAKLLIADLLGVKEIKSLELRPQEYSMAKQYNTITIYRIDFKAEIVKQNGEHLIVLIEIQKAKYTSDIMRFRKYLGEQYGDESNTMEIKKETKTSVTIEKKPLPIITIYFLGYELEKNAETPIIRVQRQYLDNHTRTVLKEKENFIESLTHDSIIVQIPALKHKRRNDLEKALSVFEAKKGHEVNINEDAYPEKYKPVIRRLLKAFSDKEVRQTMDVEDELLNHLELKERTIQSMIENQKKVLKKTNEIIKNAAQEIHTKNQEITLKNQEIDSKNQEIDSKNEIIIQSARLMKQSGIDTDEIAKFTGLSAKQINQLQK